MFGLRQVFMPESGFPQLLPPLSSIIYWRDTAKTQIIWTKSTGTSFPQPTLMVTLTHLSKTECGESGVSDNPCTEVFPGDEAFSEIETRNIRDFVQTLEPTPILSHCFHSYSQLWLWPYGYDYDAYPENREELEQMAIDACDAIYSVHGTIFDPINSADLYPAAGAADDWYKGVLGSRFAFTTELRDTGRYGFILPPDQIIESGEEIWAAMEVIIKQLLTL